MDDPLLRQFTPPPPPGTLIKKVKHHYRLYAATSEGAFLWDDHRNIWIKVDPTEIPPGLFR